MSVKIDYEEGGECLICEETREPPMFVYDSMDPYYSMGICQRCFQKFIPGMQPQIPCPRCGRTMVLVKDFVCPLDLYSKGGKSCMSTPVRKQK